MRFPETASIRSRRDVLRAALAVGAAAPLALSRETPPHLQFPSDPRQRLSVTSYPFRTLIESPTNPARDKSKPGMDLKEFPAMIAQRFGVYNINPLADHLASTNLAYLDAFRKAVADAKSHVVDLGLAGKDFGSESSADDALAFGRRGIDIAQIVGSPSIRQHLRAPKGGAPSVDDTARGLERLAAYGARKNVIVNLENDSLVAEEPYFIVKVIAKVNSPFLRALPDFGNSLRGHDASYNRAAVAAMFKYAYNICHVKDVLVSKDGHSDHVDVAGMFAVAHAGGYRGYFSMEYDTAAGDPFGGTENLVRQSLQILSAT